MRSMVERDAPPSAALASTPMKVFPNAPADARASLSTVLRTVPLSLTGEE